MKATGIIKRINSTDFLGAYTVRGKNKSGMKFTPL